MSESTKGVICTGCKDIFFITTQVERAIRKLIAPGYALERVQRRQERIEGNTNKAPSFTFPVVEIPKESHAIRMSFTLNDEQRALWIFFHCDADNDELAQQSISLSIGAHGDDELIIKAALNSLKMFGKGYYRRGYSDASVLEFDEPLTFMKAINTGYARENDFNDWSRLFQEGFLPFPFLESAIGIPLVELMVLQRLNYNDRCAAIKELATKLGTDELLEVGNE